MYKVKYESSKLQCYILRFIYFFVLSSLFFVKQEESIYLYKILNLSSIIILITTLLILASSILYDREILNCFENIYVFSLIILSLFSSFNFLESNILNNKVIISFKYFIIILMLIKSIKFKKSIYRKGIFYLIIYIFLFSLGNVIFFYNITNIKNTYALRILFCKILYFSADFVLVEGIIRFSLNRGFNNINKEFILKEKRYKKDKICLKRKLKKLEEIENILYREENLFNNIISNLGEYIFIFKDGELIYLNNEALNFLESEDKESILFKNIEFLYEKILKDKVYLKKGESFSSCKKIIFKNIYGGYSNGEISKVYFGGDYEIIVIYDTTKKNNALRLNKYLSYKLKEDKEREFFESICYELRTPISVISLALKLNNLNIVNNSLNLIERNNKLIKGNCLRLIKIINNFIDANKILEGEIDSNLMVINVVEVIESVLDSSLDYINKKNMNFVFDPDLEEIFVPIDSESLEKIIFNLLFFLVKYGKEYENIYVKIYFEENNLVITMKTCEAHEECYKQAHDFNKYTNGYKMQDGFKEENNLGFYISKSLMKMQGGDLEFYASKEGFKKFKLCFYDIDLFKKPYVDMAISSVNYYNLREKAEIEFSDI